ncbi:MAG: hypothetical protein R6V51_02825 [Dehalococcoidia bacterium]
MEPRTRADFHSWAEKHDWVRFGGENKVDIKTPSGIESGVQESYVTPTGNVNFPIFLNDILYLVGIPTAPPPPQPVPQRLPGGLNIPGFMPPPMGRG